MTVTAANGARAAKAAETRRRILDATIEVLLERGYRGTSTLEVQKRAGVSRGALLHHFPSRAELMVATVEHLRRIGVFEFPVASGSPQDNSVRAGVQKLWSYFQGPLYVVAVELWQAARSDKELLAVMLPQERATGEYNRQLGKELFPTLRDKPGFDDAYSILLDSIRGAATRSAIRTGGDERLINRWVTFMESL